MAEYTCTGAVLIGGKSSRFGAPKHEMALPDGQTMLAHVIDALEKLCQRVVLIGGANAGQARGPVEMADVRPGLGPLAGIEALLASGMDSQYLICPCDVPLITGELLGLLLQSPEALATVFQVEGRDAIEPLPARVRAEVLPAVRRLLNSERRSVWQLMKEIQPTVVTISREQALRLHNVNTPKDFEEAARVLSGRES